LYDPIRVAGIIFQVNARNDAPLAHLQRQNLLKESVNERGLAGTFVAD
jgi:hypothetical protein